MVQFDRMAEWLGSWATSYERPGQVSQLNWLWEANESVLAAEEGRILKELSTWTGWSALSMATSLVGIFVGWRGLKAVANQERLLLMATCFLLTGVKWACWKRRNFYWERSEAAIRELPDKIIEMGLSTQNPFLTVWVGEQREILSDRIRVGGDNAQPLFEIQRSALRYAEGLRNHEAEAYLAQFTGLDANEILRTIPLATAE